MTIQFEAINDKSWIGIETDLDDDEEIEASLDRVRDTIRGYYKSRQPDVVAGEKEVECVIQAARDDRPIGLTLDDIESCTQLNVLKCYRKLVEKDDKLRAAYLTKFHELNGGI